MKRIIIRNKIYTGRHQRNYEDNCAVLQLSEDCIERDINQIGRINTELKLLASNKLNRVDNCKEIKLRNVLCNKQYQKMNDPYLDKLRKLHAPQTIFFDKDSDATDILKSERANNTNENNKKISQYRNISIASRKMTKSSFDLGNNCIKTKFEPKENLRGEKRVVTLLS